MIEYRTSNIFCPITTVHINPISIDHDMVKWSHEGTFSEERSNVVDNKEYIKIVYS